MHVPPRSDVAVPAVGSARNPDHEGRPSFRAESLLISPVPPRIARVDCFQLQRVMGRGCLGLPAIHPAGSSSAIGNAGLTRLYRKKARIPSDLSRRHAGSTSGGFPLPLHSSMPSVPTPGHAGAAALPYLYHPLLDLVLLARGANLIRHTPPGTPELEDAAQAIGSRDTGCEMGRTDPEEARTSPAAAIGGSGDAPICDWRPRHACTHT
ncbi:hypothetical protein OH76DRAFT_866630 [Lentinus brumalis]|uniref:Uncharacterized protein n=1 Tax=Lentinus brumalis TaxID=2498619 RepID=A0A371DRK8_9APHY|nr:hypothetical protein OH76DRAFT_866630 [Polyporus brumalis]